MRRSAAARARRILRAWPRPVRAAAPPAARKPRPARTPSPDAAAPLRSAVPVAAASLLTAENRAILHHALEEAARLLRSDGAMAYLLDPATGILRFADDAGITDDRRRRWVRSLKVEPGVGMFGRAVARAIDRHDRRLPGRSELRPLRGRRSTRRDARRSGRSSSRR